MMRGFLYNTGTLREQSLWSNRWSLWSCDALMFGPQLWAGRDHMLPGQIWSPHRGNRVKANPDRRFANVLSPLALHQIACDEYIPYYPPDFLFSLVLAGRARCSLSGLIMKVWLERLFLLFYSLLTATAEWCGRWQSWHHYKCWIKQSASLQVFWSKLKRQYTNTAPKWLMSNVI